MADNADSINSQLPLRGVVLCSTSLPHDARIKLADVAAQMGAVHMLDLTADVTHLVVGSITTPKYQYVAKERPDIQVLHPDWIDAVRTVWMDGGDVDCQALEQTYKLGTFPGLQICLTGFDNVDQRTYISSTAETLGATYHRDLTKTVTHLIAAEPTGAKYTAARQWRIKTVSLKWFEDSLRRGMVLDESLYDPLMPAAEQGQGSFRCNSESHLVLGKRTRQGETQGAESEERGKRKLRRTASKRLDSQSQGMWQDISSADVGLKTASADHWKDDTDNSIPPNRLDSETADIRVNKEDKSQSLSFDANAEPEGLFSGRYVLINGFDQSKTTLLKRFLEPNGASVVRSSSELEKASQNGFFKERYLLVPHAVPGKASQNPEVPAGTLIVTEWWLERCIHYKRILDPAEDVLSGPLWDISIPGFPTLCISTTGFNGVDVRQVAEVVRLAGGTYEEKIQTTSSVLISGSASIKKEKAFYARKHRIPVVTPDWLWKCLKTKQRAPYERYSIALPPLDMNEFIGEPSKSSTALTDTTNRKPKDTNNREDHRPSKRLSATRKKCATPSLSLKASERNSSVTITRPQSAVHDESASSTLDSEVVRPHTDTANGTGSYSHPLQEVSPNASPHMLNAQIANNSDHIAPLTKAQLPKSHSSTPMSPSNLASPAVSQKSPACEPTIPEQGPQGTHAKLTANLAELLRQPASRPGSAAPPEPPQKRKRRPLGRNLSTASNRSASAISEPVLPSDLASEDLAVASDGLGGLHVDMQAPPSTQLGYETLETEAHRAQMSEKMGTNLHDDDFVRRVANVGTVKDSGLGAEAGVGSRVRGRYRERVR